MGEKDFIPESIFYRLVWKSRDANALKFQSKVADEILPSIRQNGLYINPNAPIDPRFLRRMADALLLGFGRTGAVEISGGVGGRHRALIAHEKNPKSNGGLKHKYSQNPRRLKTFAAAWGYSVYCILYTQLAGSGKFSQIHDKLASSNN